ncbi:trypsin-like peptidase domain-containing protein [Streptomyces sp. NPDC013187]|uniref:S1C family serine protease n=1 Tax=Streptomyces sp. NPDC013187 TaxID=3364865 RepID=UPI00369B08FD
MNEGKPTKAKWWSRPRSQDPAEQPEGPDQVVAEDPGGNGVHGPATAPTGPDGDFELPRPAPRPDGDGDYELRRPEAVPTESAGEPTASAPGPAENDDGVVASAPGATDAGDGEVGPAAPGEALAPAASGNASTPAVPGNASPAAPGETPAPAAPGATLAEGAGQAAARVPAAREVEQGVPVAPVAPAGAVQDAPRPLHDPDPYSTPPYGEPGPWAPAPPVQHPATIPGQGMAAPGQPTVLGTPAVPSPPEPHGAPSAPATGHPAPSAHPSTEMPHPGAPGALGDPAPVPAAPVHTGAPAPAPDPWQRYDPWAAPGLAGGQEGPFQQNGAAVLSTEQRRRRGRTSLVLGAVLLALVSGGLGGAVGTYLERNGGVGTVELPQAGKEASARDADSVAGIAGRALPSVVTLHVSGAGEQGTGTGFVLDTCGHILTNNHVVRPAGSGGEITVTFNGGQTAKAEVVGRDSGYDLAVVKVKGVSGLTPLPLGNSDNVQVGDPVVAIGAPFDLAGTVTSGIISATQRPITAGGEKGDGSDVSYVDALQTDAPINPGNSGGPLLDARARVIGINSAIRSADSGSTQDSARSGSIGLGFAIPINQGKRVAEELINTGKATHPVIGITLDMDYTGDGARVAAEGSEGGAPVTAGGPGARAGIKSGDVITEVDGARVHSGEELIVKTRAHRPGDRLELTVERGGKERTVSLVLGSSDG